MSETDPLAEAGRPTAGNGAEIARLLSDPHASDADARTHLTDHLARLSQSHAGQRVLLSSEWFETLPQDRLQLLLETAQGVTRDLRVLYLVRHVADHALSLYSDRVWRKGETDPFEAYIADYDCPFRSFLDRAASVVGREALMVRVYDDHRSSLVGDVLSLLGCPIDGESKGERVNRSLSRLELEMIRRLCSTSEDSAFVGRLASEHAYRTRSLVAEDLMITQRELAFLEDRLMGDIRHINQTYLTGEEKLNSCSDGLVIADHREAHGLNAREQMLAGMLEAALAAHEAFTGVGAPE